MDTAQIVQKFEELKLDDLKDMLHHYYADQVDETVKWIEQVRSDLVETLREVDGEDVEMALAVAYAELKARWIGYNTRINYKMIRKGFTDPADVFRGCAVWWLNSVIMGILKEEDIDRIDGFLAEPIERDEAA